MSFLIKNEKYCGDLLLQKFVTLDYLTHRRVKNDGHSPQYFVKDNQEAIVDRETWKRLSSFFNEIKTSSVALIRT